MAKSSQSKILLGVGISLGVSVVSGLSYLYHKYTKKEAIPANWKKVGTLEELYFYPIKSCAAVELDVALCENLGVREGDIKDRALMLIDRNAEMVSARTYPKMFQIVPKIVGRSKLVISAPGMKDLELDYSLLGVESSGDIQAIIYGFNCTVMNCGDEYHKWFSEFLTAKPEGLRLVYYPYPIPTRPVDKLFLNSACTQQDTGSLQDVSSYMLINNASVQDLNSRLKNKITPLQFRANFYVRNGGKAFEEDHWQWIRIGEEAVFRNVGPCYRCIIPNINPFSGERDADGEPLKTLKTYRVIHGAPTKAPGMGIQMGLRKSGSVKSGDDVYVEDLSKE